MRIDVVTLFPEMIKAFFQEGVSGRAIKHQLINLNLLNPRQFTTDVHQTVDDRPYGGGPGMVMRYDVLKSSLDYITEQYGCGFRIYMTPQGRPLSQSLVTTLVKKTHLVIICGRYEGIDQRLIDEAIDLEISLGDFVLSGGEIAAVALIDSITRWVPGVLGHQQSASNDSFANGILDYPHYTRPKTVNGKSIPDVLISGNHADIERWRQREALGNTWLKRPDLFAKKALSEAELCLLNDFLKHLRTRSCE